MSNEDYWYQEGKKYLGIEKEGMELFKKYLVNCDELFKSNLFHHELAYLVMRQLGERINNITLMVYDEEKEELYILLSDDSQFKYSLQEDGIYLNDFMIDVKSIYIPEFGDSSKLLVKE